MRWPPEGQWVEVASREIDCAILFDPQARTPRTIPVDDVRAGKQVVIGVADTKVSLQGD